jgi:transposase-like protein
MPVSLTPVDRSAYRGHRFPSEITAHAVWLYFRFHLSFRDVQDLLAERGVVVSHEAIRQWCTKFGASFAAGLRRRRVRAGDKWHLDEVALKIRANVSGCGEPLTSTESYWTSWSRSGAIR